MQKPGFVSQVSHQKLNMKNISSVTSSSQQISGENSASALRRADIVWPLWSCDLTPLDYYLWGAVKDKCYADKPETIDALRTTFVKPLVKYSCTQSIMCLKIRPTV